MNTTPVNRSETRNTVVSAIRSAADRTGINFDYLYHQARLESGLNPAAAARTSSARGLFQFLDQTWLATVSRHGAAHGLGWAASAISRGGNGRFAVADPETRQRILNLRNDPAAASAMAGAFARDNRDYLAERLGRPIQAIDLYIAHFLGPAGAANFLSALATNPGQSAAQLMPAAAAANRPIFYHAGIPRSVAEVRDVLAVRMGAGVAGTDVSGSPNPDAMPIQSNTVTVIDPTLRSPQLFEAPDPYRMPTPASPARAASPQIASAEDAIPSEVLMASMTVPVTKMPRNTYASLAYLTLAQLGG